MFGVLVATGSGGVRAKKPPTRTRVTRTDGAALLLKGEGAGALLLLKGHRAQEPCCR